MVISIIGVDCAAQSNNVGLARGVISDGYLVVDKVLKAKKNQSVAELIVGLMDLNSITLLALDSPLGWPASLGKELVTHLAGECLASEPNKLFRRHTDHFIKQKVGKQSLDVGADRIARTAHAALNLINEVEELTGSTVPLAWKTPLENTMSAIEVYPAVTLKLNDLRYQGYKKKENIDQRREIVTGLAQLISLNIDCSELLKDDDVLDAVICTLAGYHFINDKCIYPTNKELAIKEGWIWVEDKKLTSLKV